MTLHLDPSLVVPRDLEGDPIEPPATLHALVVHRDGDGWNEPHSETWECSCGHLVSAWTQSDPDHADRPMEDDVFAAHAVHVSEARAAHTTDAERFVAALLDARAWLDDLAAGGGPDLAENVHLKVAEEAQEVAADPDDIIETADVAIALVGLARRQRWTLAQVTDAIVKKTARNRARQWMRDSDGVWRHVA